MNQKPRSRADSKKAKTVLRLPDLEFAKSAVLSSLTSLDAQRGYRHAIDEFVDWYCSEPRLAFNRIVVLRYRTYLETRQLASGTINLRLGAVRRLAYEAADCGLLSSDLAAGIRRVKGVKKLGVRLGNWLTAEQSQELWQAPDNQRMKGKRDRALLALLLACGLRRHEAVSLRLNHLQQREEHWAIVDLLGKGGHIRTVPIPGWVVTELNEWLRAAEIDRGRIFRKVNKMGRIWGDSMTEKAVWHVVKECAKRIGVAKLAPHDLRRTCAKLCQASGGELEQIQFLLGHVSVQTTERYLGWAFDFMQDVADRVRGRVQLTTDGHKPYLEAVENAFGMDVDFATLQKIYGASTNDDHRRYSPAKCIGSDMRVVMGDPDPAHISTSYVERQNLTMGMSMRRFTRLTNGFSKKIDNHAHSVALHFMHYNYCRVHKTLRVTPAMEAGLSNHIWSLEELAGLMGNTPKWRAARK